MTLRLIAFWFFLVGLALAPFLFGGRLFSEGDAILYYYPVFDFYHQTIAQSVSFLWNPSIFLGLPIYLSQSAGFFDPLNWMLFHLPTFTAYHLRLAIDLFLVLAFSYGAGRQFGLTRLSSLLIGMGYIVAFNWRYLSNVVISNSLFLLPFLFYAGLRLFKATREWERWAWIVAMGAAVGWSFISGYAQFVVYSLFVFGIFYAYYFFFILPGEKNLKNMARWAGYGLSVVAIGFVIGLPQILPALEFTPLTVRSEGVAYEVATYKTTEPGDVILAVFPDYLYFPYVSSGRKPLYVGVLLFVLALVGIREALRSRKKEPVTRERKMMRVLLALLAFCFVVSLKWSPVFYLMQKLPVFELFRFPYRWMYIGAWFLAVLGAYGFDTFYNRKEELRHSWLMHIVAWVGGGIVAGVLLLNFAGAWFWSVAAKVGAKVFNYTLYGHGPFIKEASHYQEAFIRGIDAWRGFLSLGELKFAAPFFILVAAGGLMYWTLRRNLPEQQFRTFGFVLSVVTFLAVFMVQWPYSVPATVAQTHSVLLDRTFSDKELTEYRTFPFLLGSSLSSLVPPTYQITQDQIVANAEMQFATGWPNMHMYDGREVSVDGYDVFAPADLVAVLGRVGSTHGGEEETKVLPQAEVVQRLLNGLDIIGMLSGKFIVSGVPLVSPSLTLRTTWPVSHLGGEVYVYENSRALPRWYFAHKIISHPHTTLIGLLETVDVRTFAQQTYLDCISCVAVETPNKKDTLVAMVSEPATKEFLTNTTSAQWLVFNESFLPGWEASIDGIEVPIMRANGMGMAVLVPKGDRSVTFEYLGVLQEGKLLKMLRVY